MPRKKQPGLEKPWVNTSYDHLCKAVEDCLVPVKLLFFEKIVKKLNEYRVVVQTDNLYGIISYVNIGRPYKTLTRKFILKHFRDKSCSKMRKLGFNNGSNQKATHLVNLGFPASHEIQLLKSSKKITDSQILKLKKEAMVLLAVLCTHLMERTLVKPFFCQMPSTFISKLYRKVFWNLWEII